MLSALPVFAKKQKRAEEASTTNSGYSGTLPDVTQGFQHSQTQEAKPIFEQVDGFNDQNKLTPVPLNNPAFINIIQKKDKTSQYVNDLVEFIPMLEKLENAVENNFDVQKFNAATMFFDENVSFFRDKYKNKSESSYASFQKLMQLNMHAQTISTLRKENEVYKPYLAYGSSGYIYSSNNINQQLEYLLREIEETILVIKETK